VGLVLDWQKKLGYKSDPFDVAVPVPAAKFIIGMHDLQEKVNLWLIKDERFGTVAGEKGTGKTMFLQWMNEQLAPQKSHAQHYLDASIMKKEQIITTLLSTRLTLFERMSKAPLKASAQEQENMILQRLAQEQKNVLLVDNASSLGKQELEFLMTVISKTPTHVLLADTQSHLNKLNLASFSDKLKLEVPSYSNSQLTELLEKRIRAVGGSGTFPFDDEEVSKLIKKADRNPAKLLQCARERAIELSLKVQSAPKPAPSTQGGFLSIKVQKQEQHHEPVHHTPKEASEHMAADAAALTEILNAQPHAHAPVVKTAVPPPEDEHLPTRMNYEHHEKTRKTKHDKMVEQLVEQLAKPAKSKKAKKKR
jgi:type II secretory pathway predicted ATPase ExeA